MNPDPAELRRALLRRAAQGAAPKVSAMFENVRFCSVAKEMGRTNPVPGKSASIPCVTRDADPIEPSRPPSAGGEGSKMFGNVRKNTASVKTCGTKPIAVDDAVGLSPRQVSAARMMMLGQTCRATAAALGVEEHTIYRWKKLPAFAREVDRLQRLMLVESASTRGRAR